MTNSVSQSSLAPQKLPVPQQYIARLEDKQVHNEKYVQYKFELSSPHRMPFVAGQYVSIKVSETGERRAYSICSSPGIDHSFELLVDIEPNGAGCRYLQGLDFGQEVSALGPMGRFVVDQSAQEDALVFVATGSGIAPFRSMIFDLLQEQQDERPIVLYWGLRYVQQLFWEEDFQLLADAFSNFSFHPVLSRAPEGWTLSRGRVTDCLTVHQPPVGNKVGYYICGSGSMVADTAALLQQKGVPTEHIHHEKFF